MQPRRLLLVAHFLFLCILGIACGGGGGGGGGGQRYTVGGTVSGLVGTLVLQNNGADNLTVSQNGSFAFPTGLAAGASYAVTVLTPPSNQRCTVAGGTGTVGSAGVTSVIVSCGLSCALANPQPDSSSRFGAEVRTLATGNVVVTDPLLTVNGRTAAGAVYLFNGRTCALISTLTGTAANEAVGGGGIGVLTNGNLVVFSNYGAVDATHPGFSATFVDGTSGLNGTVSAANSLIQTPFAATSNLIPCGPNGDYLRQDECIRRLNSLVTIDPTTSDFLAGGSRYADGLPPYPNEVFTFLALPNGNYLILSVLSNAVTFGNGRTGVSGAISPGNSLIGTGSDVLGASQFIFIGRMVDYTTVFVLPNSDYLVRSGAGMTLGNGRTGTVGSLPVPTTVNEVGSLTNGNYVLVNGSTVALVNGDTLATVSTFSGGTASAYLGASLTNGNFVVTFPDYDGGKGAATFINGTTGLNGTVSPANSLIGGAPGDQIGYMGAVPLRNGNYVVPSPFFGGGRGAATFGNGATGIVGTVSSANSLVGAAVADYLGSSVVTRLSNGGYVVRTPRFNGGAGAATFGSGTTGVSGIVSASNSLVGASSSDAVAIGGVKVLPDGNYVVRSPSFATRRGAATFGSGTTGIVGTVSSSNSLVGTVSGDEVGREVVALSNGNYLVVSSAWSNGSVSRAGAVTWGSGTGGVVGSITSNNSLVGSHTDDRIGNGIFHDERPGPTYSAYTFSAVASTFSAIDETDLIGAVGLSNGNYVVMSPDFDGGKGAATFGNGTTGSSGVIDASNSLVGSVAGDHVSGGGVAALSSGNYLVMSPLWSNGSSFAAGAVTFGNGSTGASGAVSASNSLVGGSPGHFLGFTGYNLSAGIYPSRGLVNGSRVYYTLFAQGGGSGNSVTDLNQFGINPMFSLVSAQISLLSNGNYVVRSPYSNGEKGAVTLGNGATGIVGTISDANSIIGSAAHAYLGAELQENSVTGTYVVSGRPEMAHGPASVSIQASAF